MQNGLLSFFWVSGAVLFAQTSVGEISPFSQVLINLGGLGILSAVLIVLLMRQEQRHERERKADREICEAELARQERRHDGRFDELVAMIREVKGKGEKT